MKITVFKQPPYVKHVGGRPDQEAQGLIIAQALANLRMPKAARKLMTFYASCGTGFRPSLKVIDDATYIGTKNVSTVRQYLVHWGFIAYDGDTILIDWHRLRAFAMMDPKLMGNKKDWRIKPVNPAVCVKTQVHNYYMRPRREEDIIVAAYEAIGECIQAGVHFKEMESRAEEAAA